MQCVLLTFLVLLFSCQCSLNWQYDNYKKYSYFSESDRRQTLEEIRQMFIFGYDNYMTYAFPSDELDPIHCTGRGPDYADPDNININDVLGDYALTLIDTLDTLVVMGNISEFKHAVQKVIEHVSFEKPNTVQVFEATIRIIGGLLSAHLLIVKEPLGTLDMPDYDNELLTMAHDLAARLIPAFDHSPTGIPYPRVHLCQGVPKKSSKENCLAGAGTLVLEFGLLSHLLDDPIYESIARKAVDMVWARRSNVTGLFGFTIDVVSGHWLGLMSGLGAGFDSFYEYLLKSFIMFGHQEDLTRFNDSYEALKYYLRKGRKECNEGEGQPPMYVNVNMRSGDLANYWVDALQAAWPGVQVLYGDVDEAICSHALFFNIWRRFGALPERYNWQLKAAEVKFYPLRPELMESTYLLYQATKHPFYLHVGRAILDSLNNHTKVRCGYATIHDVITKQLEDRMESFFLSETCKYLYLLFDTANIVNAKKDLLFSTEGHIYPIIGQKQTDHPSLTSASHRKIPRLKDSASSVAVPVWSSKVLNKLQIAHPQQTPLNLRRMFNNTCAHQQVPPAWGQGWTHDLPLRPQYFRQLEEFVGLFQEEYS